MKKTLVTQLLILLCGALLAQDLHFSQFHQSPLLYNPALAGAERQTRLILNYRDQWRSVDVPFNSFQASADGILFKSKNRGGRLAAGLNVFYDKALSHVQANASIAYHVPVSDRSSLGAGLQFGYAQRSLNPNNLKWGSQFDGNAYNANLPGGLNNGNESRAFLDMGAGLVWQYRRGEKYMTGNDQRQATVGLALFHPHRPDQSFYGNEDRLNPRMVFYADALLGISNTELALCPQLLFASQGPLTETTAGLRLRRVFQRESTHTGFLKGKAASIGAAYRVKDAIIPSVSIELGALDIGLSYDINISSLRSFSRSRGGTELAIRYMLSRFNKTGSTGRY